MNHYYPVSVLGIRADTLLLTRLPKQYLNISLPTLHVIRYICLFINKNGEEYVKMYGLSFVSTQMALDMRNRFDWLDRSTTP